MVYPLALLLRQPVREKGRENEEAKRKNEAHVHWGVHIRPYVICIYVAPELLIVPIYNGSVKRCIYVFCG
eukprot:XP_001705471.1 Hypothetical protein GL50803_34763 [Giardia lamblia ATCC 50803]